jgi:hypothetical protein
MTDNISTESLCDFSRAFQQTLPNSFREDMRTLGRIVFAISIGDIDAVLSLGRPSDDAETGVGNVAA